MGRVQVNWAEDYNWSASLQASAKAVIGLLRAVLRQAHTDAAIDEAEVRAMTPCASQREMLAAKVTAWEWFFGSYHGLPGCTEDRLTLEDVCTAIGVEADDERDRVLREAKPPSSYRMPEGARRDLLSLDRNDQIWVNRDGTSGLDALAEEKD